MASIANDPNGRRRILFMAPDGSRKTIRLGKISQRGAEAVKHRVELLLSAKLTGHALDADTSRWVAELGDVLLDKLIRAGLVEPRSSGTITLGEHLDDYFGRRTDVKQSTRVNWGHTKRCLLEFFGNDKPLRSITTGDAEDWERWLQTGQARENAHASRGLEDGLAPNTVRKRISNAKQFFQNAVHRDLLVKNPFAGLKGAVGANHERDFFITREMAEKVLDACPDAQWRLIFALSRYGGLRCPSEHLALRWEDVDWVKGRIRVRSPKTEHHAGKGQRVIPIFPELRPYLEDAREMAPRDTEYVVSRHRDTQMNLRTQMTKIIERAGLVPWPKLFQNLRASRATELANEYPEHVAAAWAGHSTQVAKKHYWQVTDDHFQQALGEAPKAAQNPAQLGYAGAREEASENSPAHEKPRKNRGEANTRESVQMFTMGDIGLEPTTPAV